MAGRDRKAKTAGRMDSGHAQLFDIGRKAKAEIAKAESRNRGAKAAGFRLWAGKIRRGPARADALAVADEGVRRSTRGGCAPQGGDQGGAARRGGKASQKYLKFCPRIDTNEHESKI